MATFIPWSAWHQKTNSALLLSRRCPKCCQYLSADRLPDCVLSATLHYQWVLAGPDFVKTEYTFPFAEKVKPFLDDPSAFTAAVPVAACHYHYCCCCCCSTRQGWSQESEELDEDIGFGLQLICSEQPTWPAQFKKHGNIVLLLFKKKVRERKSKQAK